LKERQSGVLPNASIVGGIEANLVPPILQTDEDFRPPLIFVDLDSEVVSPSLFRDAAGSKEDAGLLPAGADQALVYPIGKNAGFMPKRVSVRSSIVRAAPTSACRMARVASTSTITPWSVSIR
jgi:hypothetical protein